MHVRHERVGYLREVSEKTYLPPADAYAKNGLQEHIGKIEKETRLRQECRRMKRVWANDACAGCCGETGTKCANEGIRSLPPRRSDDSAIGTDSREDKDN